MNFSLVRLCSVLGSILLLFVCDSVQLRSVRNLVLESIRGDSVISVFGSCYVSVEKGAKLSERIWLQITWVLYVISTLSLFLIPCWLQNALTGNKLRCTYNAFCHRVAKCVTVNPHCVTF